MTGRDDERLLLLLKEIAVSLRAVILGKYGSCFVDQSDGLFKQYEERLEKALK